MMYTPRRTIEQRCAIWAFVAIHLLSYAAPLSASARTLARAPQPRSKLAYIHGRPCLPSRGRHTQSAVQHVVHRALHYLQHRPVHCRVGEGRRDVWGSATPRIATSSSARPTTRSTGYGEVSGWSTRMAGAADGVLSAGGRRARATAGETDRLEREVTKRPFGRTEG